MELWEHLLGQFAPLVTNFQLQVEVTDKLVEDIAIELYPRDRQCWQQLLTHLTNIGFCLPEKRSALLSYEGSTIVSDNNLHKKNDRKKESRVVCKRELGYLKMSYHPNQPISFKAYIVVT